MMVLDSGLLFWATLYIFCLFTVRDVNKTDFAELRARPTVPQLSHVVISHVVIRRLHLASEIA